MSLGFRPPNFEELGAIPEVAAAAGAWPKAGPGATLTGLNALLENGVAAAGAPPPKADPLEEPPKGLGAGASVPDPNALLDVEPNGDLVGAGAAEALPKGNLFSPPPKDDAVLEVGAVVAVDVVDTDTDADADAAGAELNGDLFSPPPKGDFDAPNEAVMLPKPNDVSFDEDGAGVGAALSASGLEVLYFCASLANISGSLPLYLSNVFATSCIFCALCF
mmetsp:Transcript_20968/g.50509  ORF Transcript_20968/g.50509 Transcript_20968/m.50509 type:complete len:220 (-) Transcript_20968:2580-3239(-)